MTAPAPIVIQRSGRTGVLVFGVVLLLVGAGMLTAAIYAKNLSHALCPVIPGLVLVFAAWLAFKSAADRTPALVIDAQGLSGGLSLLRWIEPIPWSEIERFEIVVTREPDSENGEEREVRAVLRDDRVVYDQLSASTAKAVRYAVRLGHSGVISFPAHQTTMEECELLALLNERLAIYTAG